MSVYYLSAIVSIISPAAVMLWLLAERERERERERLRAKDGVGKRAFFFLRGPQESFGGIYTVPKNSTGTTADWAGVNKPET